MTEKKFKIENLENAPEQNYKGRILKIINDLEQQVRFVAKKDSRDLHQEVHRKYEMTTSQWIEKENKELENVRKDICESFGVSYDQEHVYIPKPEKGTTIPQRPYRAFVVLIDALRDQKFYGEDNDEHYNILHKLVTLAENLGIETAMDEILPDDNSGQRTPNWLFFKGFLSNDGFQGMPERTRSILKTPIMDEEGNAVETPDNWFISGSTISRGSS